MWNKLFTYLGCLLFILIMVVPYKFQFFKLGIALFLIIPSIVKFIKKEPFPISKNIMIWVFLFVFMGLFYIVFALIKGNPGPMLYFPVYVLWPILFWLITLQINKDVYMKLIVCMRHSFTIIAILGIVIFVLFNLSLNTINEIFVFRSTYRPGFPFIAIASGTITNMIFLYVFFWSLYIIDRKRLNLQDKLNLILGFVFIFASSRRVIFMILAISVVFVIVLAYLFNYRQRQLHSKSIRNFLFTLLVWTLIIIAIVVQFDLFDFELLWKFINSAVGSDSAGVGWDPRLLQFDALIEGWLEFPLLGNGTGVDASVVRSEIPGTYELSYVALLFERGILGVLIYAVQFILLNIWLIKNLHKGVIPASYGLATLAAFDMFLFANATNPYLGAFDHIWVIFMVLIFIDLNQRVNEKNWCSHQSL